MKNILPTSVKQIFSALALSLVLVSCNDDKEHEEPTAVAGPTETEFSMMDSIKVAERYKEFYPELYSAMNGKIYKVSSKNKTEVYFMEEENEVIITIEDTSKTNEQPWVTLTFKNRTVSQLPTTFSLKDASVVCVKGGQSFADGSHAFSPSCMAVLDGTVTLQYDKATDVINGSLSNLKYSLEYYVPDYSFPSWEGVTLRASGSNRNINFTFKNMKRKKLAN